MAACDLETLPLFCVRRWRVTSSFNFALKLHHPVQLVCTCGKGFQKEYKPDPKPTGVKRTGPPQLPWTTAPAEEARSCLGGVRALSGEMHWGVIAGMGRDVEL